jgi:hypothetical protein
MDFEIEPKVGIAGLSLGAAKATVRQFFKTEPRVFQRRPLITPPTFGPIAERSPTTTAKAIWQH